MASFKPPLRSHKSPRILSSLPPARPLTGEDVWGDVADATLTAALREKGDVRTVERLLIELVPLARLDKGREMGVFDLGPRGGKDIACMGCGDRGGSAIVGVVAGDA